MKKNSSSASHLFNVIYAIIVLLTAIVGLRFVSIYFSNTTNITNTVVYDKYYVMITDNNESSFWQSVYASAYEYGLTKNVFVEDLAATFDNELTKEELMRIAIASNVDGIFVSADDSEEMKALIDEAAEKSIPVVTMYNDSPSSMRVSYVGVDNYNIGKEYGREALSAASDIYEENSSDDINVVVLVDLIPSADQMMIYSTVKETLEADALSSMLNLSMAQIDSTNAFSVEETIRDLFMSEDIPDIIICLSELDTTCVYQAVIDYNRVGQVDIFGYFASDSIYQGINRRIIDSTIMVDATQMGVYCVDALYEYDQVGFTNQYFAVDFDVINYYNVRTYISGEAHDEN